MKMKKVILAGLTALALTSAQAAEMTVFGQRDVSSERNGAGFSVGKAFGPVTASFGVDKIKFAKQDVDTFWVAGTYDVVRFGKLSANVSGAGAFVRQEYGTNGYALLTGVGLEYDITKTMSAVVDFRRQFGQDKIKSLDGNVVAAGLRYKF